MLSHNLANFWHIFYWEELVHLIHYCSLLPDNCLVIIDISRTVHISWYYPVPSLGLDDKTIAHLYHIFPCIGTHISITMITIKIANRYILSYCLSKLASGGMTGTKSASQRLHRRLQVLRSSSFCKIHHV